MSITETPTAAAINVAVPGSENAISLELIESLGPTLERSRGTGVCAEELQYEYEDCIYRRNAGVSLPGPVYNYVPGEYEGISGTFANACRVADRERRQRQSTQPSRAKPRLPKSLADAIAFILKQENREPRLREFLQVRPSHVLDQVVAEFGIDVFGIAGFPADIISELDGMNADQLADFLDGLPAHEAEAVLSQIENKS
jgi:hypothetical protein